MERAATRCKGDTKRGGVGGRRPRERGERGEKREKRSEKKRRCRLGLKCVNALPVIHIHCARALIRTAQGRAERSGAERSGLLVSRGR